MSKITLSRGAWASGTLSLVILIAGGLYRFWPTAQHSRGDGFPAQAASPAKEPSFKPGSLPVPLFPQEAGLFEASHFPVTLLYSGLLEGDLEPCGCTKPPTGGISRRATLYKALQEACGKQGKLIVADSGDSLINTRSPQISTNPELTALRAQVMARYIKHIGVGPYCIGEEDLFLGPDRMRPLWPAAASLIATNTSSEGLPAVQFAQEEIPLGQIAILSVIDKQLFEKRGLTATKAKWSDPVRAIRSSIEKVGTPALCVMALHGLDPDGCLTLVSQCAQRFPTVVLENNHLESSSNDWRMFGDSLCLTPSANGTSVSLARLLLHKEPTTRWRSLATLVTLDQVIDRYQKKLSGRETPEAKAAVTKHLDQFLKQRDAEYQELLRSNVFHTVSIPVSAAWAEDVEMLSLLKKFKEDSEALVRGRTAAPFRYKGASNCATCHPKQYENWQGTRHAKAFEDLTKNKDDKNPNCIVCHVAGFGFEGGARKLEDIPPFLGVQCESCHVPTGEKHPGLPGKAFLRVESLSCMGCHNPRQDPKFNYETYVRVGTCLRHLEPGEEHVHGRGNTSDLPRTTDRNPR